MTIYVDQPNWKLGRMRMCHMVSDDSLEELHEMADRIGVDRQHFQSGARPHYDVCKSKRELAIKFGAEDVPSREVIFALRRLEVQQKIKRLESSIICVSSHALRQLFRVANRLEQEALASSTIVLKPIDALQQRRLPEIYVDNAEPTRRKPKPLARSKKAPKRW